LGIIIVSVNKQLKFDKGKIPSFWK